MALAQCIVRPEIYGRCRLHAGWLATGLPTERLYFASSPRCPITFSTSSPQATQSLGVWIGARLPKNAIVGLDGPLGAGKTCMAQGIARGWGLPDPTQIVSPAYNLVIEHRTGQRMLAHMDFYRLDRLGPGDALMIMDILERPNCAVLVEWADKFLSDLADGYLSICLERQAQPEERSIKFQVIGNAAPYADLIRNAEAYAQALD